MAIKFYKKATAPTDIATGNLWFDTTTQSIKVKTASGYDTFGAGLKNAVLADNKLTITKSDNTTVVVDLSDVASASSVADALALKANTATAITGEDGLTGGGTLAGSRQIKHAVSEGAGVKSSGLYKIATDKFGHVIGTTAVTKTDITNLGIPSANTNTTYTFTGGTNGFSVTPSGGTAMTVTVTPSITNNVLKTGTTTVGYIPKFNNASGTIENGYSVDASWPDTPSASAIPTTAAVNAAINDKIAAADAMIYKGTLGNTSSGATITAVPTNSYKIGWTYKVITAATWAGYVCEIGDMLIALKDGPATGTSVIAADWTVVQTNINGAVTGPASATVNHVAIFNSATGKVIKDSGFTLEKSVPLSAALTDTKVTSADNHYTPTASTLRPTADIINPTATNGTAVVTNITRDSKGHITEVNTKTAVVPTLSDLGGIGSISPSASAPLSLTYSKSGTAATLTGSVETMTGASSSADGARGVVPAPTSAQRNYFLKGDGTWAIPTNTNTTYTFTSADGSSVNPWGTFKVKASSAAAASGIVVITHAGIRSLLENTSGVSCPYVLAEWAEFA